MKKVNLLLSLLLSVACSNLDGSSRHDWADLQPYVTAVSPEDGAELAGQVELQIELSHPILAETLTALSVFWMSEADYETYADDWRDMIDDIEDGDVEVLPLSLQLSEDQKTILAVFEDASQITDAGVLVVTPKLLSQDYVPLNQGLAGVATSFYAAHYTLPSQDSEGAQVPSDDGEVDPESQALSGESEDPVPQTQSASYASGGAAADGDEEGQDLASSDIDVAQEAPVFTLEGVVITEVVTDPQQDFNDSLGGNSVIFDALVGSGTVGSTDEYIEIYNGSSQTVDLTGWSLTLQDGTDVTQVLSASTWPESNFSADGDFSNFLSGEFAVLGNPDGQMNNQIALTLLDGEGQTVDAVFIEDANAESLADEAYTLDLDTGLWSQAEASPGF